MLACIGRENEFRGIWYNTPNKCVRPDTERIKMTATRLLEICEAISDACKDYQVFVLAESLPECMPIELGLSVAHYPGCFVWETCDGPYGHGMKFSDFKKAHKDFGLKAIKYHWSKRWGHDHYWDFADRMPVIGDNGQQIIFYLENETRFVDGVLRPPRTKRSRKVKG